MSDFTIDRPDRGVVLRDARTKENDYGSNPNFRKALPVADLSPEVADSLKRARVDTAAPYELEDLPEIDET